MQELKRNSFKVLQKNKYDVEPVWDGRLWRFEASGADGQDPEILLIVKAKLIDRKGGKVSFFFPNGESKAVNFIRWRDPQMSH